MDQTDSIKRRSFLKKLALGSTLVAGILASLGALRAIIPKLTKDTHLYKLGPLADFPINAFTLVEKANIYIFRDHQGVRAVSAICTHLGCLLEKSENGFDCPCHGSQFDQNGAVQSGPAPRSLTWFAVELAADGQRKVNKNSRVRPDNKFLIS